MFCFCRRPIGRVVFLFAWLFAMALWPVEGLEANDWPPVVVRTADAQIEASLDDSTTLEFIETPLADVVDYLKDLHGIEIQIDHECLEDIGIGSDTPITRNLKGISLRSALTLMLREMELTFLVRDEVLLITTREGMEGEVYTEVYNISSLTDERHPAQDIVELLANTFDDDAPKRKLAAFRELVVLKGHYGDHQQVRRLLGMMAAALEIVPPKPKVVRARPMPMEGEVRAALAAAADDAREQSDPFGGAADPFGGGERPVADPFSGGDDPFSDPVPAGGDPFGGPPVGDARVDDPFADPMPPVAEADPFDPFAD